MEGRSFIDQLQLNVYNAKALFITLFKKIYYIYAGSKSIRNNKLYVKDMNFQEFNRIIDLLSKMKTFN
ncbi:hypothetical protein ES705_15802 [subsurface metagenome]